MRETEIVLLVHTESCTEAVMVRVPAADPLADDEEYVTLPNAVRTEDKDTAVVIVS